MLDHAKDFDKPAFDIKCKEWGKNLLDKGKRKLWRQYYCDEIENKKRKLISTKRDHQSASINIYIYI
jgi:hypothetical protein